MQMALRVIQGEAVGTVLVFPPGRYFFGRERAADVRFPNSSTASRRHCMLYVTEDTASVLDLGSRHGTVVNYQRINSERSLQQADRLGIGGMTFRVEITHSEICKEVSYCPGPGWVGGEGLDFPLGRSRQECLWRLMRGAEVLALLHPDDQRRFATDLAREGTYEAAPAFDRFEHLFRRELELWDCHDELANDEWFEIWEELKATPLLVESPDGGERVEVFWIHFAEGRAWWLPLIYGVGTVLPRSPA